MTPTPLAAAIIEARRSGALATFTPDLAVQDVAQSYAAQAQVARALDLKVAGWKVGFAPSGAAWAAPLFASDVYPAGATVRVPAGRSVKVEAELGVRFARDLPPRPGRPYAREEILDAIDQVFAGIELVASRFANAADVPFETRIADLFNNASYAIGDSRADFRSLDLAALHCRLTIGGKVWNDRAGGHANGDPMAPLVAWASQQADALGGLKAGQFLTTGTLNDPVPLDADAMIEAELGDVGRATLSVAFG
ncbi:MAG: hypothetical protein JWN93_728 [Hyphomicrobiales bacterium]|nr:hypothetical protein [Hyphomicrobiales bacterium]